MRKQVFGRHLKRDTHERKALFRGLASSLIIHEKIVTTEAKAKSIRGHVEKLVTKALKADPKHAISLLQPYLNAQAVKKMMEDVAPRFATRPGGYTRMTKIGQRFNDNADMVRMEWVEKPTIQAVALISPKSKSKKEAKDVVASATKIETAKKKTASKTEAAGKGEKPARNASQREAGGKVPVKKVASKAKKETK